jgi:hypothetical protein
MGNEATKDGKYLFPTSNSSMDHHHSSSSYPTSSSSNKNKRSRVSEEPVVVEMTTIQKSKSKERDPEKPKTQKQLNAEINQYRCTNTSCCKEAGGCFLRNFCSSDQSSILLDNAVSVLQLFREKTRILNKEEEGKLALSLFKAKCTNLAAVISPTGNDSELLYGGKGTHLLSLTFYSY